MLFIAVLVLDGYLWSAIVSDLKTHAPLTIDYLNIGQGDSQLITLPGGARMMIDAGPPQGRVADELDQIVGKANGYIDLAIITHPELDHFGGYIDVLKRYRIGAVLMTGKEKDTEEWKSFADELKNSGTPIVLVRAGDAIDYGASHADIISPDTTFIDSAETNDAGVTAISLGRCGRDFVE